MMGRLGRGLLCAGLVAATLAAGCDAQAPDRALELDLVESDGCADVFVFKTDAERSTFLVVDADAEELGLAMGQRARFDLGDPPAGLEVRVDVYAEPPLSPPYCNDVITAERPVARWRGVAGRVSITLGASEADGGSGVTGLYRAVVVLEDLTLEDGTGRRFTAEAPIEIAAEVGWLPG